MAWQTYLRRDQPGVLFLINKTRYIDTSFATLDQNSISGMTTTAKRPMPDLKTLSHLLVAGVGMLLLSACASSGPDQQRTTIGSSPIQACRASDTPVATSAQCLADDAACYQLSNGSWCTGPRDNVCPSGSTALAAGEACPKGARCFAASQNLTCAIL